MLTFLMEPRSLFYNGEVRILGGSDSISPEVLNRCMTRMSNWVHLSTCVLRSEFPNFEILQAFGIFTLREAKVKCRVDGQQGRQVCDWAGRISNLFGLNKEHFIAEYEDHKPMAQRFYDNGGVTTMQAWALAVQGTQKSKRCREIHPATALIPALARFGAYGGSTSGVERLFAATHRASGLYRADLSEDVIDDELHLLCDMDDKENDGLALDAQRVWATFYGKARETAQRAPRIDAGIPKVATTFKDRDGHLN